VSEDSETGAGAGAEINSSSTLPFAPSLAGKHQVDCIKLWEESKANAEVRSAAIQPEPEAVEPVAVEEGIPAG
jgi:hypothetical protein